MSQKYALEGIANVGIAAIRRGIASWSLRTAQNATTQSLVEATKTMRVEPLCVIDHTLQSSPGLEPLVQNLLNIFSAYYLQAAARDSTIGSVSVFRRLDRLNPKRSKVESLLNNSMLILESMEGYYDTSLPALPKFVRTVDERDAITSSMESLSIAMENNGNRLPNGNRRVTRQEATRIIYDELSRRHPGWTPSRVQQELQGRGYQLRIDDLIRDGVDDGFYADPTNHGPQPQSPYRHDSGMHANAGPQINPDELEARNTVQDWRENLGRNIVDSVVGGDLGNVNVMEATKEIGKMTQLAVGKILNVEFVADGHRLTVPIAVRMMPSLMLPNVMIQMLTIGDKSREYTLKERWHAYKSGKIQFWRDFIFWKDLEKEQTKNLLAMRDDRTFQKMKSRMIENSEAGAASANPSLANISNIIIINKPTLQALESQVGGKIANFNLRERIFANTGIMLFAVVDNENQRVKIYHHSIEECSDLSFNELKRNEGKEPNIQDMLNVFLQGGATRL